MFDSMPKRVSSYGNTFTPHVVLCPYCGAKGGRTCHSVFGTQVSPHPSRVEAFNRVMDVQDRAFERESRLRRQGMI
ncbi:MAG: hypothetical protein EOP83_12160 [Verrucomicrobiaceae bacterium]|nr:MAG: hypothetical protein EOP83_12160 [Verrucomicrobiaceae bacterium]